ncbi:MAG: hypothetical protein ACRDOY_05935, partial [Nocardioidaceae bacterium]
MAYESFVGALRRHLSLVLGNRLLSVWGADPAEEDVAVAELLRSMSPRGVQSPGQAGPSTTPESPSGGAWADAAASLRLAHDVLASHLGPDRQYLTPDSHLVDQPEARRNGLSLLGALALTNALAAQRLGLRVAEVGGAGATRRGAERALFDYERVVGPAERLVACGGPAPRAGDLSHLRPATRTLPVIETGVDPLTAALIRVDWLAQRAHDAARGATHIGALTMQAFAALGVAVNQHSCVILHAMASQGGEHVPNAGRVGVTTAWTARAERAREAAQAWRRIYQAWDGLATPAPGSRLVVQQVTEVRQNLAEITRPEGHWKESAHLVSDSWTARRLLEGTGSLQRRGDQIAASHDAIVRRGPVRGQLYMSRRDAPEDLNVIPLYGARRYTLTTGERIDSLCQAYQR